MQDHPWNYANSESLPQNPRAMSFNTNVDRLKRNLTQILKKIWMNLAAKSAVNEY